MGNCIWLIILVLCWEIFLSRFWNGCNVVIICWVMLIMVVIVLCWICVMLSRFVRLMLIFLYVIMLIFCVIMKFLVWLVSWWFLWCVWIFLCVRWVKCFILVVM